MLVTPAGTDGYSDLLAGADEIEAFDQQLEILGALRDEIEGVPSE